LSRCNVGEATGDDDAGFAVLGLVGRIRNDKQTGRRGRIIDSLREVIFIFKSG